MQRLLRLQLIFELLFFMAWYNLGIMAFFIAIIADHSKNIFFRPGYYININNKSIRIYIFLGLVLTIIVFLIFPILFIQSFNSIFGGQRVI